MRAYQQLTLEQRYQISALKKAGHTQAEMTKIVGVHKSTISRELSRNTGKRGYRPQEANRRALERRQHKAKARITTEDWERVGQLLEQDWSPEQISGRLRRESGPRISHEWIYLHVYADKHDGGDLHTHLRCRKKRRKRYGSYDRRGRIPGGLSIDDRPAIVDDRRRIGDWEGDTIIGKNGRGVLISAVERKSLFTVLTSAARKTAIEVCDQLSDALGHLKDNVHTLTLDNGKEFAEHRSLAAALDARIYFAHPYASWERGTNENTNGLIRQYFPKSMDLSTVTTEQTRHAADRLNHRPRKRLGFLSPFEVLFNVTNILTQPVALTS